MPKCDDVGVSRYKFPVTESLNHWPLSFTSSPSKNSSHPRFCLPPSILPKFQQSFFFCLQIIGYHLAPSSTSPFLLCNLNPYDNFVHTAKLNQWTSARLSMLRIGRIHIHPQSIKSAFVQGFFSSCLWRRHALEKDFALSQAVKRFMKC